MATIAVTQVGDRFRIVLRGRLTSRDLKRLERACHQALQQKNAPIELDLDRLVAIDPAARAYVERLRARGASISGRGPGHGNCS